MSTLPVGEMRHIHDIFSDIRLFYCPPMVRQGNFLSTFTNPPSGQQLIGYNHKSDFDSDVNSDIIDLYKFWLNKEVAYINVVPENVAEIAKLCINMMLSTKIIIANSIAKWVDNKLNADLICQIVNHDPRIGTGYFTPGGPAAGRCLPRDIIELENAAADTDLSKLLKVLNEINKTGDLI